MPGPAIAAQRGSTLDASPPFRSVAVTVPVATTPLLPTSLHVIVVPGLTTRNCFVPPGQTALTATPVRSKYRPSSAPSDRFTLNTDFCGVALTVNGTVSSTCTATGT